MTTNKTLAWHFAPNDGKLNHGDGRQIVVVKRLGVKGDIVACENGMHASVRPLDALRYTNSGALLICRVELSGQMDVQADKIAARYRKVIAMADATKTLHEFACWCAEQALLAERAAGREPDERSWKAIEAKRLWLLGRMTLEDLNAARAAARAAADAAAYAAADAAAYAAADAAAYAAAYAAARAAARAAADAAADAAAGAAADAAAYAAADAAQNEKLESMFLELLGLSR